MPSISIKPADINALGQYCNVDSGQGWVRLYYRDKSTPITYMLVNINNPWYHIGDGCTVEDFDLTQQHTTPVIRRLTAEGNYELYHQRLGHPGERAMSIIHKHVDHIPPLKRHDLYKCEACEHAKRRSRNTTSNASTTSPMAQSIDTIPNTRDDQSSAVCGQHFSIDYGFMRGSTYTDQDDKGHTVTSIDGYRSYCLIIDRRSRYTWTFLTKTKHPPIELLRTFLQQHGNTTATRRTLRTDEGGELWQNTAFRQMALETGYNLEPTAAGAPFQNGLAERPNQTLGNMVRALLYSAGLGPEYWSFALQHAVYLKNRLPHTALNDTPLQVYTGKRPSAKNLRVFGCPIIAKLPGKRPCKLDTHTCSGIFLGYTATERNIYYKDTITQRIKITTHCSFDEGGLTLPPAERSPSATTLYHAGLRDNTPTFDSPNEPTNDVSYIKLLTSRAKMPTRTTDGAAGYDLYSAIHVTIDPKQRTLIPLDITTPPFSHGQLYVALSRVRDCNNIVMYLKEEQLIINDSHSTGFMPSVNNIVYQDVLIHKATLY